MSIDFDDLVDRIYEAAALPDLWSAVLSEVSLFAGGEGALLFTSQGGEFRYVTSPSLEGVMEDFMSGGWAARNDRPIRLFSKQHAGFLTDLDVYTIEELDSNPMFTEFLRPHGFGWGAASAVQVPSGEQIIFDVERAYARGPVPASAVERLDQLRPHLARAATMSARLRLQAVQVAADALELVGLPAAVLGRQGQALAMNESCEALLATTIRDGRRFALRDAAADSLLSEALQGLASRASPSTRSIPVPGTDRQPPMVVHVLPVRRTALDLFIGSSALVVVTPVVQGPVPGVSVLGGLFDLTPAEARVARLIAAGHTVEQIARQQGASPATVRTQLKAVLRKTGVSRQAELSGLLTGVALPLG